MAKQAKYQVADHAGVTHVEYEGKLYNLDKLTAFEKQFLYGKTQFIERVAPPAEAAE